MINSDRQLHLTRSLITRFRINLIALNASIGVHTMLVTAQRAALTSQIEEMEDDVASYEALHRHTDRT